MGEALVSMAGGKKFASGEFTPTEIITEPYTISGLGFTPTGGLLFRTDNINDYYTDIIFELYDATLQRGLYGYMTDSIKIIGAVTSSSDSLRPTFGDGSITFYADAQYGKRLNKYKFYWIAWARA